MTDREKVVNGLKLLAHWPDALIFTDKEKWINPCCEMAIAMLKEQEPVEPKQVDLYGKDEWWGLVCVCPDCKAEWISDKADTHFCPNCGRPVKWE